MPRWCSDPRRIGWLKKGVIAAGWAYLVAAVALVVLLFIPSILGLFGYRSYVIYGGSMGAALREGSVGLTRKIDGSAIKVGDVVAVKRSSHSTPVLHRVVEIDTGANGVRTFVTRGDANKNADAQPVTLQGAGDRVVFSIPWLGYAVHFARSFFGRVFLLIFPATLLTAILLWQTWREAPTVPYFSEEPQC